MTRFSRVLCAALWMVQVSSAPAADAIEPVLQPDPIVLAKLVALGDNSSCILEGMRIIEDLGDFAEGWHRMKETGPTGRDFTIKMAWMPDRKRAFFCGANHGSPHRFNDAWEYNKRIWSYDPDQKHWSKLTPRGPAPPFEPKERVIAYMDLARNVFVAIGYGRSGVIGTRNGNEQETLAQPR